LAGKKIRSTIIVDPDIWKEVRIESIRRDIEISQFVELALKKELMNSLDERRAKIEAVQDLGLDIKKSVSQRPQQAQRKDRKLIEQSRSYALFEKDTVIPEPGERERLLAPGERSAEINIVLPGVRFPTDKFSLIDFANYLDNEFEYGAGGYYYDLFKDLPEKTYTNKAGLEEVLITQYNTSKKGSFGQKVRVVGVNLLTTKEEIEAYYKNQSELQAAEEIKKSNEHYKQQEQRQLEEEQEQLDEARRDHETEAELEEAAVKDTVDKPLKPVETDL
jgi:hypothetical protein